MNNKTKIIILMIIVLFILIVILTEIKMRPKLSLINDVKNIVNILEEIDYKGEVIEIIIDNKFELNSNLYYVEGNGVIFLEEEYSVMLSRNGMCALKMPYSNEIMFQDEECPKYRLIDNKKVVID